MRAGRRSVLHGAGARSRELPAAGADHSTARWPAAREAIHPGYGFLSENADFAEACEAAGIAFIGPTPQQMRELRPQAHARARWRRQNGLPLLPGSGLLPDVDAALTEAQRIGYPVMLKSTAGGGGIGMQLCRDADELQRAPSTRCGGLATATTSAMAACSSRSIVRNARHIEVQIFGDGHGKVIALGERDCSMQRRNQKVIEETPAPGLTARSAHALHDSGHAPRRAR